VVIDTYTELRRGVFVSWVRLVVERICVAFTSRIKTRTKGVMQGNFNFLAHWRIGDERYYMYGCNTCLNELFPS
jgi:hypothetical protein